MHEQEMDRAQAAAWFGDEVMRLLPDLLSGALHMAGNRSDAEDLVAETVVRAWSHRRDLRERERFRGWLFRILRNCFLSECRKKRPRPEEVPLPEEADDAPSFSIFEQLHQPFLLWSTSPEEQFLDGLLKEDLQRALDGLPEPYRTVVFLADVQGFAYAEIADALEIPVGTVRSRLARGRGRLQQELWSHAVDRGLREPGPGTREMAE